MPGQQPHQLDAGVPGPSYDSDLLHLIP